MSGFQDLKDLFSRRLLAADLRDEAGKTTRSGYENELHRQRKLLQVILTPEIKLQRADVPQPLCPNIDQEENWSFFVKEKQEELSVKQDGEQLQGHEEAETTDVPFNIVIVKDEEDEDIPLFSQLHNTPPEQMETEAVGKGCVGAEPFRNSDPDRNLQAENQVKTEETSEPEITDMVDYTKDYSDFSNFRLTENSKHEITNSVNKSQSCSECGKTFEKKHNLIRHMRIHTGEKPYSCSECGKRFAQKSHETLHMTHHRGDKPFSCTECGKRFAQKPHLTRHMAHHTGEKPFSCSECGKTFRRKGHLNIHMKIHEEEQPFSCPECGETFRLTSHLNIHMRIHRGKKLFICSVCSKTFGRSGHLNVHMRIHTGEKPFSCSECGKRFTQKDLLKQHMVHHTGEKPFACNICDQRFSSRHQLKRHKCSGGQTSALEQHQSEGKRKAETGVDDGHGEGEPARNSDPERSSLPETEVKIEDFSDPETEDSDDY